MTDRISTSSPNPRLQSIYGWALAVLIAGFAVWPALATPIEEHAYDAASFHIYRGVVFSQARADGVIYPYWVAPINDGLGGPLFVFYSPLVYFGMDALHALGLPHTLAWRALVALALIAASTGMFGLGLSLFRRADCALAAAACFVYSPTLLRDLFERGAPQGMALAWAPWLLWLLIRLADRPSGLRLAPAALAWAAILLIHNLTGLMLLPVIAVMLAFIAFRNSPRAGLIALLALIAGLLLAAIHVIPFLAERGLVQIEQARAEAFSPLNPPSLSLSELLALPPVLDAGLGNNTTGYGLGLWQVFALALSLAAPVWLARRRRSAPALLVGGLSLIALAAIGLRLELARPVWDAFPALSEYQIRWRLITLVGLAAAVGLGYALSAAVEWAAAHPGLPRWLAHSLAVGSVAAAIALQLPMLYPGLLPSYASFPAQPAPGDYMTFANQVNSPGFSLTAYDEFVPRWRSLPFSADEWRKAQAGPLANLPPGGRIIRTERSTGHILLQLDTPQRFNARLYQFYYPGWEARLDGQPMPVRSMLDTGYLVISVPAGQHTLDVNYAGTPDQHAGALISLIAAAACVIVAVVWRSAPDVTPRPRPDLLRARWWVVAGLAGLIAAKGLWIDPATTLLRASSSCASIRDATAISEAVYDGRVRLCGFEARQTTLRPGDTLTVSLYWQLDAAQGNVAYTYLHLLGSAVNPQTGNSVWGQQDKQLPARHPLTTWLPGKLYRDDYAFQIPANTPPGAYSLETGWTWPDGTRLAPTLGPEPGGVTLSPYQSLIVRQITVAAP